MYKIKSNNDAEKIADVFCFDNSTDFGYYNSYRNFCKQNMIYFSFVYGSKNVRVNSSPKKVLVSENSSENIRTIFREKASELTETTYNEVKKLEKYILIEYVDGQVKYFEYKEGFEEIFEIYEPETRTQEIDVLSAPYLTFETGADARKAEVIESVSANIKIKKLKQLFEVISEDCTLEVLGSKFVGIKEIKKEYKRRVGFLNTNLSKVRLYTMIEGTIDENKNSILELNLEITDSCYKKSNYIVHMDFNQTYKINRINITPYIKESRISKIILDKDLSNIKREIYNDFK
ncbi:MAG: hypothetical protein IKW10_02575 [Oscillospiraceae bacterium]|nr:hypothetical protein [Oscillospiraceae bacterium]